MAIGDLRGKNGLVEVLKNLNIDLKILFNCQNNYVRRWLLKYQNFLQHCSSCFLHNYFDGSTRLFWDLYLANIFRYFSKIVFCV